MGVLLILILLLIISIILWKSEDYDWKDFLGMIGTVEDDSNFTINGGVYNDLVEYNNKLRSYKLYTHNFWVGWFYADTPAELDYIELVKDTPQCPFSLHIDFQE